MKWFTVSWWKYLFKGCRSLRQFRCRINRHRCGPVWFNAGGLEPDMWCRNYGEGL